MIIYIFFAVFIYIELSLTLLTSVSTAPKHFNQPEPSGKLSKNQRKKIKKKAKAKQALLDKQIKDLEELEAQQVRLAACTISDDAPVPGQCAT